jgi:hypothetical protein
VTGCTIIVFTSGTCGTLVFLVRPSLFKPYCTEYSVLHGIIETKYHDLNDEHWIIEEIEMSGRKGDPEGEEKEKKPKKGKGTDRSMGSRLRGMRHDN